MDVGFALDAFGVEQQLPLPQEAETPLSMGCELLPEPGERLNLILGAFGGFWCQFLLSNRWDLQGCVPGRCKWIFAMVRFEHGRWIFHWCTPQKNGIFAHSAPTRNALGCLRGSQAICVCWDPRAGRSRAMLAAAEKL